LLFFIFKANLGKTGEEAFEYCPIGTGRGSLAIEALMIVGGNIIASCPGSPASGSGTGAGDGGTRTWLSLSSPLIVKITGVTAQSFLLSNGSLVIVTQANALLAGIGSLSMPESVDLAILFVFWPAKPFPAFQNM
jgi:hypothetical protein